jgi:hypothetical protein
MKANKTIRWKVIDKHHRESIFIDNERYPKLSLRYFKNKITKALPFTLGIMCFDTKKNAKQFIDKHYISERKYASIIKVKTFGKGQRPKEIVVCTRGKTDIIFPEEPLLRWSKNRERKFSDISIDKPPKGTICYPAVMPLE